MRKRLIKLIKDSSQYINEQDSLIEQIADHLLVNSVIAPPCKLEEKVYCILFGKIEEGTIDEISITKENTHIGVKYKSGARFLYYADELHNNVFLEREKAAQMAIDGKTAADVVPKSEVAKEILADFRKMIKGYENIDVYLDRIEKKYTEGTNEN